MEEELVSYMLKSGFSETSIEEERHGEPREKQCA